MNKLIASSPTSSTNSNQGMPLVQVERLSAWYGKRQVLDNISFSMQAGDFICLSGPNGCGKSTLMTVLAGLGRHKLSTTGSIQLEGCHLNQLKSKQRAKIISYMSQTESNLWNFTVQDVILTGRYCHTGFTGIYSQQDREIAREAANQLQLQHLLDRRIHSLSGGEFQRALRHDLLQATKELAQQQGTAVLMSIHDINLAAAFAQTLALLRPWHSLGENQAITSQLLLGSPQQVMTPANLQQVYNRSFQIFTHPIHRCPAVWVE